MIVKVVLMVLAAIFLAGFIKGIRDYIKDSQKK